VGECAVVPYRAFLTTTAPEIEIARLSTLAITQTSIIIKYSLNGLYAITIGRVTKKKLR
jgi:hypothetical protein